MTDQSDELGALWPYDGKAENGPALTGIIDLGQGKERISVFEVEKWEEGSKVPRYRILRSKRQENDDTASDQA